MLRVFITGANRGIGLGLAGQCLQRGYRVFAGCRNPEQAAELHRLQDQHSDRLTVLPLDVTDQSAIENAATTVKEFVDGLDLLVNNAGVGGGEDPFGQLAEEGLIDTFRVNAVAPILLAQAMLPLLKKGQRPVIASVTSRMGSIADNGSGGYYAYRASKAALNMLHKSLAVDLAQQGIITVVLHPGWVRTDMGGQGGRLSVEESVAGLLQVVDGLTETDSGRFFDWRGKKVPW